MVSNVLKSIVRKLVSDQQRKRLALRLLGGSYVIAKKDSPDRRSVPVKELEHTTPEQRPVQNILSTLPHLLSGYLSADWFWADSYYPVYTALAQILHPRSLMEIGSLQGFSLISLLNGSPEQNQAVWVDNELYLPNSNQMCYENVSFFYRKYFPGVRVPDLQFHSSTWDLLQYVHTKPFDLIHIDGEHSFEGKLRDLMVCHALSPRFIILDDYANTVNHKAIKYWAESNRFNYAVIDTFERGMAFFDFSKEQDALSRLQAHAIPIKEIIRW